MSISKFVFNTNNTKLKDLISIKEFKTKKDLIDKMGSNLNNSKLTDNNGKEINLFLTESEFIEKYKWLNVNLDNVYYNIKSFTLTNAVIYLDIDKLIVYDLTNLLIFGENSNLLPSDGVSGIIERLEEKYYNKNYSSLLLLMPDSFKIEILEHLVNSSEVIDEELYSLFMDYYKTTDFGFNSLNKNTMSKLFNGKSEKLKFETKEKLAKFPDKIIVYRGQADKSSEYTQAYSWTLSPHIATFFSLRLIERSGKIVTGVVDKNDIMEYFDDEEEEVLILPGKVKDIKVYDFHSMDYMSDNAEDILDIFGHYKYILNNCLNFEDDVLQHGKKHALRVLLHSLSLGKLKGLNEYNLRILALASIYHDIGRVNDKVDDLHGLKSYKIFEDSEFGFNNDIIKFLIQNHCIKDDIALENLKESNIKDKNKAKELFYILKDADALDRLRFGLKDLDFTYLRNEEAIRMIMYAHFAVKHLKL